MRSGRGWVCWLYSMHDMESVCALQAVPCTVNRILRTARGGLRPAPGCRNGHVLSRPVTTRANPAMRHAPLSNDHGSCGAPQRSRNSVSGLKHVLCLHARLRCSLQRGRSLYFFLVAQSLLLLKRFFFIFSLLFLWTD